MKTYIRKIHKKYIIENLYKESPHLLDQWVKGANTGPRNCPRRGRSDSRFWGFLSQQSLCSHGDRCKRPFLPSAWNSWLILSTTLCFESMLSQQAWGNDFTLLTGLWMICWCELLDLSAVFMPRCQLINWHLGFRYLSYTSSGCVRGGSRGNKRDTEICFECPEN